MKDKNINQIYGIWLDLDAVNFKIKNLKSTGGILTLPAHEKAEVRINFKGKKYLMSFKEFVKRITGEKIG